MTGTACCRWSWSLPFYSCFYSWWWRSFTGHCVNHEARPEEPRRQAPDACPSLLDSNWTDPCGFDIGVRGNDLRSPIRGDNRRMKFTIRDLLLVTAILALAAGWWVDRSALKPRVEKLEQPTPQTFIEALRGRGKNADSVSPPVV